MTHLMAPYFKLNTNRNLATWISPLFTEWLLNKYQTNDVLKLAWDDKNPNNDYENLVDKTKVSVDELQPSENLETGVVNIPGVNRWISPRMADAQQFFYETQKDTAAWMTAYVRQIGFNGSITSYNNIPQLLDDMTRKELGWVDMHNYFAHPSNFVAVGSQVTQTSMLAQSA